jgi:hypothetical protein
MLISSTRILPPSKIATSKALSGDLLAPARLVAYFLLWPAPRPRLSQNEAPYKQCPAQTAFGAK